MPRAGQETDVFRRLQDKSYPKGDCNIWSGKTVGKTQSYGCIWYKGRMVRIGRLVCHLTYGVDIDDQSWTANHKPECTSSLCWNPDHLYVGTTAQNIQDQLKAGTFHYGTANLFNNSRRGPRT